MKQGLLWGGIGFSLGVIVSFILCLLFLKPVEFGVFDLDDYREEVEMFSSDATIGFVNSAKAVKRGALSFLREKGALESGDRPLHVFLDRGSLTWLVYTDPSTDDSHNQKFMIISSSGGEVLAYWTKGSMN